MPTRTSETPDLRAARARDTLLADLAACGFDATGIADPGDPAIAEAGRRLGIALGDNHHATMGWMAGTEARRADPLVLWPQARSVVMVAMSYGPDGAYDPLEALKLPDRATISCYAHNRDYHDVMKGLLKQAAGRFAAAHGANVKVFVDTAPLMEKPLAALAGLGWQGKHTNLVSRQLGSWFFLGAILTDMALPREAPETDYCGSCRACLDICPTAAFPAPYRLDARRCISYLTIEHHGPIPLEFRKAVGNRVYGCDDCLAACPWNKFAVAAREIRLQGRAGMRSPPLAELLSLDDAAFRSRFAGSPVKRIGRNRFVRNCLIAAGNSAAAGLVPLVAGLLDDPAPVVRGAAVWALARLDPQRFTREKAIRAPGETEPDVAAEWHPEAQELAGDER